MAKKGYLRKDPYYKKAKELGFRSRSAFKLLDINKKYRLLEPGMQVIDLGCAPGGWIQVLSKEVGPSGMVVGIDLDAVGLPQTKNVMFIRGDIREERTRQLLLATLSRKVDLVVSDIAPNLSGIPFQDHYNSYELAEQAFKVCQTVLRHSGAFLVKIFPGEELEPFRQHLKAFFPRVDLFIPPSTRKSPR